MDPESAKFANEPKCSRCQRPARDDGDYGDWEALDEGVVCPGCLTMLETHARRRTGES